MFQLLCLIGIIVLAGKVLSGTLKLSAGLLMFVLLLLIVPVVLTLLYGLFFIAVPILMILGIVALVDRGRH